MKVGIFSPYLETFGGGERYVYSVAEFFLQRGDQVDIFGPGDPVEIKKRFALDLANARFRQDIFFNGGSLIQKLRQTARYDLFFFLSDGSIPATLATKNILHFQTPFHYSNQKNILNWLKLSRFQAVVCNSRFTKGFIDRTYGIKSSILYPPVDVVKFQSGKKENLILSVGHFYAARPKKQAIMVETFISLVKKGLKNWRLVLVGSIREGSDKEVAFLQKKASGYPIEFVTDGTFSIVQKLYSRAKVYWHAAGYGSDVEKEPEKAEHFGMSTVEAMSAGAIPITFAAGGQKEIINEGKNGFFWKTPAELARKTLTVIKDDKLREELSAAAIKRSHFFSKEKFFQHLNEII